MSAVYFQQRSHLSPEACSAATPSPSMAEAVPPSPLTSYTRETIIRSASSSMGTLFSRS